MSIFEDFSRFFENRLDDFLRKNPHLELSILEEQLQEQEEDTLRLIVDLQKQEKKLQDEILTTAKEIERWHNWVNKAREKGRLDLAEAAAEREAALLRQGNQLWGKMQGCQERIEQAKEIYRKVKVRLQEVRVKATKMEAERYQAKTAQGETPPGWNKSYSFDGGADPLLEKFRKWEMDDELDEMKRNMGR
ncbi:MAG: TIGR04376 family protein [Hormoscilla sp.]